MQSVDARTGQFIRTAAVVLVVVFVFRYVVRDDALGEAVATSAVAAIATVVGMLLVPLVSRPGRAS